MMVARKIGDSAQAYVQEQRATAREIAAQEASVAAIAISFAEKTAMTAVASREGALNKAKKIKNVNRSDTNNDRKKQVRLF